MSSVKSKDGAAVLQLICEGQVLSYKLKVLRAEYTFSIQNLKLKTHNSKMDKARVAVC